MTLPVSGPISLTMIQDEFLAPRGTALRAFVRGGVYVPNTPTNAAVPTVAPLQIRQFYGASRTGGGGGPLVANKSGDAFGELNVGGVGPSTQPVTSSAITISCSGGTGSYSCTWSHISGNASISNPGSNNFNPTFSHAAVPRNSCVNAVKRCSVNDGVSTTFVDVNVQLCYFDGT